MSFHVRIAFSNVHKDPARAVLAIGDTLVLAATPQVVTQQIQKKFAEISYSL